MHHGAVLKINQKIKMTDINKNIEINSTEKCIKCNKFFHPIMFSDGYRDKKTLIKTNKKDEVIFPIKLSMAIKCSNCYTIQIIKHFTNPKEYLKKIEKYLAFEINDDGWHKEYLAAPDKNIFLKKLLDKK